MDIKEMLDSNWTTALLLVVGACFILAGIWREEHTIVMEKTINICLECVGIG